MVAAYVACGRSASVPSLLSARGLGDGSASTHALAFNAACAALAVGDYPLASHLLACARQLCAEARADDGDQGGSGSTLDAELLPSACRFF